MQLPTLETIKIALLVLSLITYFVVAWAERYRKNIEKIEENEYE